MSDAGGPTPVPFTVAVAGEVMGDLRSRLRFYFEHFRRPYLPRVDEQRQLFRPLR